MSFMPFKVFSLTRPAREVKELSSKAPEVRRENKKYSNLVLQFHLSSEITQLKLT